MAERISSNRKEMIEPCNIRKNKAPKEPKYRGLQ